MGQTTNHQFPYPELASPADVPADIKRLADAVDATIPLVPVIPPGGGGFTNIPVLDVGQAGQNRAGRQLAPADFTNLGLAVPLGIWNLGSTADASGNARTLINKGAVPFGVGINGQAATAAVFAGSTAQALYFDDQGTNDPLRIRTGSVGCWLRTAKRGVQQAAISKWPTTAGQRAWSMLIPATNVVQVYVSSTGSDSVGSLIGTTDIADDRWHHAVFTHDGTRLRLYVDGVFEAGWGFAAPLFTGSAPLNIGAQSADNATAADSSFYGRIDEAFITPEVLSDDQVRLLYCARLAHALGAIPGDVRIAVHRRRRGVPLVTTDFPSAPVRLHNFTAGALTDQGSGGVALVPGGGGSIVDVAGVDGTAAGAKSFSGAHTGLAATDAGLPAGTAPRSYGLWLKLIAVAAGYISWGAAGTGPSFNGMRIASTGVIASDSVASGGAADTISGPNLTDGLWHFVVTVEDNAAGDGVKRKLYVDGRLVAGSTVLNAVTLGGANRFRIGAFADGTFPATGQIDGAFMHPAALTADQIAVLYQKSGQDLAASTKDAGDHVERVDGNSILATFDTIDAQNTVDLGVAA